VFSVKCLLFLNILTKRILAAKWLYKAPATRMFGKNKPQAAFAQISDKLRKDGLCTVEPR